MPAMAHENPHHGSSLFASLTSILHIRSSLVSPSSTPTSTSSSPSNSFSSPLRYPEDCPAADRYDLFHQNLARRVSELLPQEAAPVVTLAFLRHAMSVLLETESDLGGVLPRISNPLSPCQEKMVNEFFDRSAKLLDVCIAVRGSVSDARRWQSLLREAVVKPLEHPGFLTEAPVRRARKALADLKVILGLEEEEVQQPQQHSEEVQLLHLDRSLLRRRSNISISSSSGGSSSGGGLWREPLFRRCSWCRTTTLESNAVKQLHSIGSSLAMHRCASSSHGHDRCTEERFDAAIYAINFVSVFFFSTTLAALLSSNRGGLPVIISGNPSRSLAWAAPFTALQTKVSEEVKRRNSNRVLWEFDRISAYVKDLYDLTDAALASKAYPIAGSGREEIHRVVKQLRQHVDELERNLEPLDTQVKELYQRLIRMRVDLLDIVSS